mmetsp:Transcript_14462/g.45974  ORF Transcript_14462/g.45974 Transcript_14462/m.45974 type:complete len:388 (-) Transcript_14462:69-1232(-)
MLTLSSNRPVAGHRSALRCAGPRAAGAARPGVVLGRSAFNGSSTVLSPQPAKGMRLSLSRWHASPVSNFATVHVTDAADLEEYICKGPLLAKCGLTAASVKENLAEWKTLGSQIARNLEFDASSITEVERLRIYHYYLPCYMWCKEQVAEHKRRYTAAGGVGNAPPLVIGISAPQGCGKTTVVEQLVDLFDTQGIRTANVSTDDFYLTFEGQTNLGAKHEGNRLLKFRGNAGSHDLELGSSALEALKGCTSAGSSAGMPRYDKSMNEGRGDRAPEASWPRAEGPVDVVLLEGWSLGFVPVPEEAARAVDTDLVPVNSYLANYSAWDAQVDSWLVVRVDDPQWVFNWRLQAEEKMRAGGKKGMTDEQVADFVRRFMPAYEAYLPGKKA